MKGTSGIEHNYVAPLQGFEAIGGNLESRVAHASSVLTLGWVCHAPLGLVSTAQNEVAYHCMNFAIV